MWLHWPTWEPLTTSASQNKCQRCIFKFAYTIKTRRFFYADQRQFSYKGLFRWTWYWEDMIMFTRRERWERSRQKQSISSSGKWWPRLTSSCCRWTGLTSLRVGPTSASFLSSPSTSGRWLFFHTPCPFKSTKALDFRGRFQWMFNINEETFSWWKSMSLSSYVRSLIKIEQLHS